MLCKSVSDIVSSRRWVVQVFELGKVTDRGSNPVICLGGELTIRTRFETQKLSPVRMAWLVVALLMPVALLNYLDRQMLASMRSSVMSDIPSIGSDANWGLMLGQFKWVYAFLSPVGGYIGDRLGRKRTICASLFVWSAVTQIAATR